MVLRTMLAVSAAVAGMMPVTATARPKVFPEMLVARGAVDPGLVAGEVLARHNDARRRAGVAPLAWDPALAAGRPTGPTRVRGHGDRGGPQRLKGPYGPSLLLPPPRRRGPDTCLRAGRTSTV